MITSDDECVVSLVSPVRVTSLVFFISDVSCAEHLSCNSHFHSQKGDQKISSL